MSATIGLNSLGEPEAHVEIVAENLDGDVRADAASSVR
jgi:hypothetical protein